MAGTARSVGVWQGTVRHGRHGADRQCWARLVTAWQAGQGSVGRGREWFGAERPGTAGAARIGKARFGPAWQARLVVAGDGKAGLGRRVMLWRDLVWLGSVGFGLAGMAGMAGTGSARFG